jgi:hypothetical protein
MISLSDDFSVVAVVVSDGCNLARHRRRGLTAILQQREFAKMER